MGTSPVGLHHRRRQRGPSFSIVVCDGWHLRHSVDPPFSPKDRSMGIGIEWVATSNIWTTTHRRRPRDGMDTGGVEEAGAKAFTYRCT